MEGENQANHANHEWLLRMEHERWNYYVWVEGFLKATLPEVATYFDDDREAKHRLNGANLHPCLVSFEDLATLDGAINEWYHKSSNSRSAKRYNFQLQDDDYLCD